MRFTPTSLLTWSTILTTTLLYQAHSAPISPSDLESPVQKHIATIDTLNTITLAGRDINSNIVLTHDEIVKRDCNHTTKKIKKTTKKVTKKKKKTTKKKTTKKKKKTTKKKKKTTKKKTTKKKTIKKKTTKKKTTKKKTTKKKTTKKKTTKRKTTKKTTKKKTTKKASSASNKTVYKGDGTFYAPGLGSCGIVNDAYDLIAALNAPQMKNGANPNHNPTCGKYIKVTGPLGTVRVKIVDTCPVCVSGDVDLSPAAFGKIADFDDGRVDIKWVWD